MICKLAGTSDFKVVSFEAFKKTCQTLYDHENIDIKDTALIYGCRKCMTGIALKSNARKILPDNVGLINLEEGVTMQEGTTEVNELPSWLNRDVLGEKGLSKMTLPDLRAFSLLPIPKANTYERCLNCAKEERITACGVCGGCYYATKGKKGNALLDALSARAPKGERPSVAAQPVEHGESAGEAVMATTTAQPTAQDNCDWRVQDLAAELADRDKIIGEAINALYEDDDLASSSLMDIVRQRMSELYGLRDLYHSGPNVVDGYQPLSVVLGQALDQAQNGKGRERHANGQPFLNQPIMIETRSVGLGFPAGQARKKILEAINCCDSNPDRAIADLLGAINYTAAAIIGISERQAADQVQA